MPMMVIASSLTGSANVPWYKIVGGVAGFIATCATIYGGILISQKTRLETRKLQLEITAAEKPQSESESELRAATALGSRTQRAIAVSIEGYVIRFILLYLVYQIVGFLLDAFNPLIAFSSYLVRGRGILSQYIVGVSFSYINLIVNVVIFIALGLPLFKDILSSLGLRPRDIFSKRLQREVISQRQRLNTMAGDHVGFLDGWQVNGI
jgi:hypothetical protein